MKKSVVLLLFVALLAFGASPPASALEVQGSVLSVNMIQFSASTSPGLIPMLGAQPCLIPALYCHPSPIMLVGPSAGLGLMCNPYGPSSATMLLLGMQAASLSAGHHDTALAVIMNVR